MVELDALEPAVVLADEAVALANSDEKEHTWFAFDPGSNFPYQQTWWDEVWAPWQLSETGRSGDSLKRMRKIVSGQEAVCRAIADEYMPSDHLLEIFGAAAALMEPSGACGRCPDCRKRGVSRFAEPLPIPAQAWTPSGHDVSRLASFVDAIGSDVGLAVIVTPNPEQAAERLVQPLFELGVRHFAGCDAPLTREVVFHDPTAIGPSDLTPMPTLVVYEQQADFPTNWLNRSARKANRLMPEMALDVLVVSEDAALPRGLRTRTGPAALALLGVRN